MTTTTNFKQNQNQDKHVTNQIDLIAIDITISFLSSCDLAQICTHTHTYIRLGTAHSVRPWLHEKCSDRSRSLKCRSRGTCRHRRAFRHQGQWSFWPKLTMHVTDSEFTGFCHRSFATRRCIILAATELGSVSSSISLRVCRWGVDFERNVNTHHFLRHKEQEYCNVLSAFHVWVLLFHAGRTDLLWCRLRRFLSLLISIWYYCAEHVT